MTEREERIRRHLREDLPFYASRCLKIQPKRGGKVPLILNPTQQYVHQKLQEQLQRRGKIRAIVLKGRKQGVSTYYGGRLYHSVTHTKGIRAIVMTHHSRSTDELWAMVRRYHINCPRLVRPHAERDSQRELYFKRLDSSFGVATAGGQEVGRGGNPHRLHASEFAFWPFADKHEAGMIQSVPDAPGTEIVLESTGNGVDNLYHEYWQLGVSGEGPYEPIFCPWFMDPTYRSSPPMDFEPTAEEREIAAAYDLDLAQVLWRREKIREFRGNVGKFKQEFPSTPEEAFQSGNTGSLISNELVALARRRQLDVSDWDWPVVAGIDPAGQGKDRFVTTIRKGPKILHLEIYRGTNTMEAIGILRPLLARHQVELLGIEVNGLGTVIADRLEELDYQVVRIDVGAASLDDRYYKIRTQMWMELQEWLETADIPDDDELAKDLVTPRWSYNSNNQIVLESKEQMRKRGVKRSPDLGDSPALSIIAQLIQQQSEWDFAVV